MTLEVLLSSAERQRFTFLLLARAAFHNVAKE